MPDETTDTTAAAPATPETTAVAAVDQMVQELSAATRERDALLTEIAALKAAVQPPYADQIAQSAGPALLQQVVLDYRNRASVQQYSMLVAYLATLGVTVKL